MLTGSTAFLSYLRLSVYMAIVAVAIVLSFHLKEEPSQLELRMARPLGIIFWLLAFACLLMGLGNYVRTYLSEHPCCLPIMILTDVLDRVQRPSTSIAARWPSFRRAGEPSR